MIASIVEGGGELPSMLLWSAGWPQPTSNSYLPTRRPLRRGDIILPEVEARWGGYVAQNTQPLFIGRAPAEYHEMFALQQEAVRICYDMLRPGQTLGAIAERINGLSNEHFHCRILMHAAAWATTRHWRSTASAMRRWRIGSCKKTASLSSSLLFGTRIVARGVLGRHVVCTAEGAQRLGKRPAAIIETE